MTPSDQAAAQAALDAGRPIYGRLDQIRGPEDSAADIMELWVNAESAMRAMLGGSTLSGQALVRELRQRGVLSLEQANVIASFWDARNRADDVAYKPTLTDVGYARSGYNELGRAINAAPTAAVRDGNPQPTSTFAPGGTVAAPRTALPPPDTATGAAVDAMPRSVEKHRFPLGALIAAGIVLVLIVAGAVGYFMFGRSHFDDDMSSAINLMTTGRTEAAIGAFGAIAHDYPNKAGPHVFLSRLARDNNPPDLNTARQQLLTAIRLEPGYEPAQREMGIFLLATHDPALARNFLIRAVSLAPNDSAAQGYLGCALMGLNRPDEAQKFLSRAGTGTWSACSATPASPAVPATPVKS